MYPPNVVKTMLLFTAALVSTLVNAGSHNHHHEQKPHVHGHSEIQLVMSQNQIKLHFESPANNIVGFEHSAHSNKEKQQVLSAKKTLSSADSLFIFKGTRCSATSSTVNMSALLHEHKNNHNEVSAQYQFTCDSVEKLKTINIQLFKYFKNIEEINVQWISPNNQGLEILTPTKSLLNIGQLL